MRAGIERLVAMKQHVSQIGGFQVRMPPGCSRRIEAIQIRFGDPTCVKEFVVLLSPRNRSENVKRRNVRAHSTKKIEMLLNTGGRVVGKADDIGEMTHDAVLAAESYDFTVCGWVVLGLMSSQ